MTREELKDHCKRQITRCELWAQGDDEKLNNSKVYQEHKLILELLEQEPKTGYWISWYEIIEKELGTEYNPRCKCSECSTEVDPHTSKFTSYCPVCGAKMVGYRKMEEI